MLNFDRSTVKHALQNIQNDCLQCLSHSFRVHQIFARGSARTPLGELTALPQRSLQRSPSADINSWFKGDLLLRGGEGRGKRMGGTEREGERRGRGEKDEKGGEGKVRPPNANSWIRPWSVMHFVDIFQ